jgi:hypothetical protein
MKKIVRKWINQPSTLQPFHKLHGMNVLYDPDEERVYFTSGDVISQQIDPIALSDGWSKVESLSRSLLKMVEEDDDSELDPEAKKIIDYNKKHFSSLF